MKLINLLKAMLKTLGVLIAIIIITFAVLGNVLAALLILCVLIAGIVFRFYSDYEKEVKE